MYTLELRARINTLRRSYVRIRIRVSPFSGSDKYSGGRAFVSLSSILVEQVSNVLGECYSDYQGTLNTIGFILPYVLSYICYELQKILSNKGEESKQTMFLTNLEVLDLVKLQEFTTVLFIELFEISAIVYNLVLFKVR